MIVTKNGWVHNEGVVEEEKKEERSYESRDYETGRQINQMDPQLNKDIEKDGPSEEKQSGVWDKNV